MKNECRIYSRTKGKTKLMSNKVVIALNELAKSTIPDVEYNYLVNVKNGIISVHGLDENSISKLNSINERSNNG